MTSICKATSDAFPSQMTFTPSIHTQHSHLLFTPGTWLSVELSPYHLTWRQGALSAALSLAIKCAITSSYHLRYHFTYILGNE